MKFVKVSYLLGCMYLVDLFWKDSSRRDLIEPMSISLFFLLYLSGSKIGICWSTANYFFEAFKCWRQACFHESDVAPKLNSTLLHRMGTEIS